MFWDVLFFGIIFNIINIVNRGSTKTLTLHNLYKQNRATLKLLCEAVVSHYVTLS